MRHVFFSLSLKRPGGDHLGCCTADIYRLTIHIGLEATVRFHTMNLLPDFCQKGQIATIVLPTDLCYVSNCCMLPQPRCDNFGFPLRLHHEGFPLQLHHEGLRNMKKYMCVKDWCMLKAKPLNVHTSAPLQCRLIASTTQSPCECIHSNSTHVYNLCNTIVIVLFSACLSHL